MKDTLILMLIAFIPTLEARYAVVYALARGIPLVTAYTVLLMVILIQSVVLIPLLKFIGGKLSRVFRIRIPLLSTIYTNAVKNAHKKGFEVINNKYVYMALSLFVAVPLPGTGVYTGALIAYLFRLDYVKSVLALFAGGVVSMTINVLLTYGIISIALRI